MTIDQYETYGQSLTQYVPGDLPAQFCYVEEIGTTDEITKKARNDLKAGSPLLVWEAFDEDLNTGGRDNYTSRIEGSLAVLYKTDNSVAGKRQARELARTAVLALLDQMRQDAVSGYLAEESIRVENERLQLQRTPVMNSSWYGMAVSFYWRVPLGSRF